jgi:hypothetical protein
MMVDLLSIQNQIGKVDPMGQVSQAIHKASQAAVEATISSASVEECVGVFCFLEIQWMGEPPRKNTAPVTE